MMTEATIIKKQAERLKKVLQENEKLKKEAKKAKMQCSNIAKKLKEKLYGKL